MRNILLRALGYARDGDFRRARDMVSDFSPRTHEDECNADYTLRRIDELESRSAIAAKDGAV